MKDKLDSFILQIPDFSNVPKSALIDYFVYFLIAVEEKEHVTPTEIGQCFELLRVEKYSNIPAYLLNYSKKRKGKKKFIKRNSGYQLERNFETELQKQLLSGPAKRETSYLLRNLVSELKSEKQQAFLQEAIDCYEIGARRAAIILVWILTLYHLYEYILNRELTAFNSVLAKNTDKRVKVDEIKKLDDFAEIPEGKFIEFCRSANIISNDVRKILEEKLGTRNSAAHPSGIILSEVKATDFILDLVENIIEKYEI